MLNLIKMVLYMKYFVHYRLETNLFSDVFGLAPKTIAISNRALLYFNEFFLKPQLL